jgi:hypothetical protein
MTDSPPGEPAPSADRLTTVRSRGFFPADYASVEGGKIYASGAYWSTLRFPAFPAVLPSMSLVAVIEVPFQASYGDHSMQMRLVDLDENALGLEVEGMFRAAPAIENKYGQPGLTPVAVPIHGLVIERPGEYSFTLTVDDREIDRYRFRVVQVASIEMTPFDAGLSTPVDFPDE